MSGVVRGIGGITFLIAGFICQKYFNASEKRKKSCDKNRLVDVWRRRRGKQVWMLMVAAGSALLQISQTFYKYQTGLPLNIHLTSCQLQHQLCIYLRQNLFENKNNVFLTNFVGFENDPLLQKVQFIFHSVARWGLALST